MNLKARLAVLMLGLFAVFGVTHFLIQQYVIFPRFVALERQEIQKDVQRCIASIENEVHALEIFCHDWASWNDTYEFAHSPGPGYVSSNLVKETFTGSRINTIAIYNLRNQLVWGRTLDLETGQDLPLDLFSQKIMQEGHPLRLNLFSPENAGDIAKTGLLMTEYGPMMAAALPILTNENTGPPRGTLVMARLITPEMVEKLRLQTRTAFELVPISNQEMPKQGKQDPGSIAIKTEGRNISASRVLRDVRGLPVLQVRTTAPRDIVRQGTAAMHTALILGGAIGFTMMALLLWLMTRFLIRPVRKLTAHALAIRETGNLSARFDYPRQDEIGVLGREFDRMLETIEAQSANQERDLDRLRMTEEQLRESVHKYQFLAENLRDVVVAVSPEGNLLYCSPAIREFGGYDPEEEAGKNISRYMADKKALRQAVEYSRRLAKTQETLSMEFMFQNRQGALFPVEVTAKPVFENGKLTQVLCVMRDISERKKAQDEKARLEAQLRQAHKMEAVGTLAGGIAHDFNNVLYPIMGFTEMAILDLPENSPARKNLEEVLLAADRAKKLVQQILAFSRQEEEEPKPVSLARIVEDVLILVRASIPSTIEIRKEFTQDRDTIVANPIKIHQVVMNICTNASYAMKDAGGVIEVGISSVEIRPEDITAATKIQPGKYVRLSISDNGPGMPRDIMERVFEPYFTTKPIGHGSGMGLAVAHAIVTKCDGDLRVYSEPGRGTSFHVYLPVKEQEDGGRAKTAALPTGTERVLLVDDEEQILNMSWQMMERLGYKVSAHSSSVEALESFLDKPQDFDVVVTDMTMPQMTGDALASRILEKRPGLPIILCTGFSEKLTRSQSREMGISAYVMKPLVMTQLAQTLRQAIDGKRKP